MSNKQNIKVGDKYKKGIVISIAENAVTHKNIYLVQNNNNPCEYCGHNIFNYEGEYEGYCDNCSEYI